jgi:hypothetical protein
VQSEEAQAVAHIPKGELCKGSPALAVHGAERRGNDDSDEVRNHPIKVSSVDGSLRGQHPHVPEAGATMEDFFEPNGAHDSGYDDPVESVMPPMMMNWSTDSTCSTHRGISRQSVLRMNNDAEYAHYPTEASDILDVDDYIVLGAYTLLLEC